MEEDRAAVAAMRELKNRLKQMLQQAHADPGLMADRERMIGLLANVMASMHEIGAKLEIDVDDMLQMAAEAQGAKNQVERMRIHSVELGKFLESGFSVIRGTPEEMLTQLGEYVKHAESLWDDAVLLHREQRYSTACFLSIVCIEECSKIVFGEFQYYHRVLHAISYEEKQPKGKNPLNKHSKKHFMSACSGALVNARMDRLLGIDEVEAFIQDCESGQLENTRQMFLYTDAANGGVVLTPEARSTKDKSLFYVCLAGELLSQILGAEAFRRGFQEKLEAFEAEYVQEK